MDTEKPKNSKGKAKLLATTGAICAMGGYICGDTIDESNRLDELSRPYEVADSIMYNVERKQSEWLAERGRILSENLSYRLKLDSLSRIAKNFGECQETVEKKNSEIQQYANALVQAQNEREQYKNDYENAQNEVRIRDNQIDSLEKLAKQWEGKVKELLDECQETVEEKNSEIQQYASALAQTQNEREQYKNDYENEQNEVRIRDNQIDSLENLSKQLAGKIKELLDEYKNRAPVENEFQAIHNCINAQGRSMKSNEFHSQVNCCIKALKKLQKKYPNETFENIGVSCSDNGHGYR